jgi:hypothetical protein
MSIAKVVERLIEHPRLSWKISRWPGKAEIWAEGFFIGWVSASMWRPGFGIVPIATSATVFVSLISVLHLWQMYLDRTATS